MSFSVDLQACFCRKVTGRSTCMCCRSQSKLVSPASFLLVDWDATRRALPMQEAAVSAPGEEQPDRSVPSGGWVVKPHLPGAGWELPGDTAPRAGRVSVLEAELPDCGGQPAQHSPGPRDGALADMLRQVLTWGSDSRPEQLQSEAPGLKGEGTFLSYGDEKWLVVMTHPNPKPSQMTQCESKSEEDVSVAVLWIKLIFKLLRCCKNNK